VDRHLSLMQIRIERLMENQKEKKAFEKQYKNVDPNYLDNVMGNISFLQPEIEALNVIYTHPAFRSCNNVKDRLKFLTENENKLVFVEKNHASSSLLKESYLKQRFPVEVDMEDVKNLLSVIEGTSIGCDQPPALRPQLTIQSFDFQRKSLPEKEAFFLEINLIKRELL